jgi:hypothetical protein
MRLQKKTTAIQKLPCHQILHIFTLMIEARAAETLSHEQAYFVEEVYSHENFILTLHLPIANNASEWLLLLS